MALLAIAGTIVADSPSSGAAGGVTADVIGAHLVSVQPCRLADTRTGEGFTRLGANTLRVRVAGRCGIPDGPAAVALSAVSVNSTGSGFLTLYPSGILRPLASNLNYRAGQIRSNAAITRVGEDGSIDIYTTSGDVVLDTTGAFVHVGPVSAGRLTPVAPRRILDTRTVDPVRPGGTVTIPLPEDAPTDATALSLVITVTESSGTGFVTTYPAGTTRPLASILNLDSNGQTRAAGGIHSVGPAGLTIFLSGGGHVIVDITGWFTGASAAVGSRGTFQPVDPRRLLDTREPRTVENVIATSPLGRGETVNVASVEAMTMAMTITSVDAEPGFITVHPAATSRPLASVLNPAGGDVVANFAIVPTSDDGLAVYSQRSGHVVVDLAGWFTTIEHPQTSPTSTDPSTTVVTSTSTSPPRTTTTVPASTTSSTSPVTTTTTTPDNSTTSTSSTTSTTSTTIASNLPVVHLTFDDGPEPVLTQQLLLVLARHNVKATFFVTGEHVTASPSILAQTFAAGHAIGNHTRTHPDLRTLTDAEILQQLDTTTAAILSAIGHQVTCMRPPFGYVDPANGPAVTPMNTNVRDVINSTGLTIEMWTHDTRDFESSATQASITTVLDQMPTSPGSVSTVLMHDWVPASITAVDQWLSTHATQFDFQTMPNC